MKRRKKPRARRGKSRRRARRARRTARRAGAARAVSFVTVAPSGRRYYFNRRGKRISRKRYFQGVRRQKRVRRVTRRRPVRELVGWSTRAAWESYLAGRYPGIQLFDAPPAFLENVLPVERSYFLSRRREYPPAPGVYILVAVWYVVYHVEDETFFLWTRTVNLHTSAREDELYTRAEELYEGIAEAINEKFDYLEVREWVGFAADTAAKFGRGKRLDKNRTRAGKTRGKRNHR